MDELKEKIIGEIKLDAMFSPVVRASYKVENSRVGQVTDFDKLVFDVETNGAITPDDAIALAARILQDQLQPFKIYKITYYARQEGSADDDPRYAVYKRIESWSQPRADLNDCEWPADEADLATGFWDDTCTECFDEKVRDHIVDMEFIPFDANGKAIIDDSLNFPSPENMNLRDRLFDIRTVDVRLTFRSKNPFYEDDLARDPNDPTNSVKRRVYGLQRVYEPGDNTLDKYLRDSVIVTVNTRNIGQAFQ